MAGPTTPRLVTAALGLLLLLTTRPGYCGMPRFSFRPQGQIALLQLVPNGDRYGGCELQANASLIGVGLAIGAAYERHWRSEGTRHGGYANLALQLRFLAWVPRSHLWRWFDPHLDMGGLLGGLREAGESRFRGAFYFALGLDARIMPKVPHLALTAQYRYLVAQHPGLPRHQLVVGLAIRLTDR